MKRAFLYGFFLALFLPVFPLLAGQTTKTIRAVGQPELALCRNGVSLKWISGPGAKQIVLERSRNGKDFESWASLKTSSEGAEFLETDFHPLSGITYYRFRQIEMDGTVLISEPSAIMVVPESNKTFVDKEISKPGGLMGEEVLVLVQDASGQSLYANLRLIEGTEPQVVDPEHQLPQGLYTITACSRQKYYSAKLCIR